MTAINQFVAGFSNADAISNEAIVLRGIFRSWGYDSDIVSETKRILPELRNQALDISQIGSGSSGDIALLHLSIGSPVNTVFADLNCKKAILYHNVTPSRYFEFINKSTAWNLALGRKQAKSLAGVARVNMADSAYNAAELDIMGYTDVKVLPLILDLEKLRESPDRKIMKKFDDGLTNILFVGRCVPNKKIEDCLTVFYHYHNFINPNSRFIHVGSFAGSERYHYLLRAYAKELGLSQVHFEGSVPQSHLNAFYRCSDVFLCMSEHEGFCIPVVESMINRLPVTALAAGAVPETMNGAGVLFDGNDPKIIAEIIDRLVSDKALRNAVITGQTARVSRLTGRDPAAELRGYLAPVL